MRGAGPRRGDADAEFARELGIGRRHESSHFLVTGLDEFDLAIGAIERAKHAVDAVPRITEHFFDAPRMEPLDKKIANGLGNAEKPRRNSFDGVRPMRLQ